jgi:hypothetical protein
LPCAYESRTLRWTRGPGIPLRRICAADMCRLGSAQRPGADVGGGEPSHGADVGGG